MEDESADEELAISPLAVTTISLVAPSTALGKFVPAHSKSTNKNGDDDEKVPRNKKTIIVRLGYHLLL